MSFDFTPKLSDGIVSISPLQAEDFDALYEVASDKKLWSGHPKKDRYQRPIFEQWFEEAMVSKHALKIFETETGKMIGSSRYYEFDAQKIGGIFSHLEQIDGEKYYCYEITKPMWFSSD